MQAGCQVPERQEGVSVVELALTLPIIVVLLFGLLEFGLVVYSKGVISNASREGARFGVVYTTPRKTEAEIQTKVQEYLQKGGFANPALPTVVGAGGPSGAPLSVNVTYIYTFQVLPSFVQGLTGSFTLTAETVMLME